jgi:valyl-tRNA synthetase
LIRGIRNTRDDYNVEPKTKLKALVQPGSHKAVLEQYSYVFARVPNTNVVELTMLDNATAPDDAASIVANDVIIYLPLAELVDTKAECDRLNKELEKVNQAVARSEGLLNNEGYVAKAPEAVVAKERDNLAGLKAKAEQIMIRIQQLCAKQT